MAASSRDKPSLLDWNFVFNGKLTFTRRLQIQYRLQDVTPTRTAYSLHTLAKARKSQYRGPNETSQGFKIRGQKLPRALNKDWG